MMNIWKRLQPFFNQNYGVSQIVVHTIWGSTKCLEGKSTHRVELQKIKACYIEQTTYQQKHFMCYILLLPMIYCSKKIFTQKSIKQERRNQPCIYFQSYFNNADIILWKLVSFGTRHNTSLHFYTTTAKINKLLNGEENILVYIF